jgi:TolB protein
MAIAFTARNTESLVVIDADTGETRIIVSVRVAGAEHAPLALPTLGGPAWSPDGSRLAFNCWDGHGDEICVVRADGTDIRQVTDIQPRRGAVESAPGTLVMATANAGPPAWSPDGTQLAVAVYPEQRGAPAGVFLIELDEGTARKVSSILPNSEIVWRPEGSSLLVSASAQGRSDVINIPVSGGKAEPLTASLTAGAREPALAPDGRRLAVSSGGAIVILDGAQDVDSSLAAGLTARRPAWSPDGRQIAFAAAADPLPAYSWP